MAINQDGQEGHAGDSCPLISWIKTNRPRQAVLVAERSVASSVAIETPDVEYMKPWNLCPHMKRITRETILECLRELRHEVIIDPTVAQRARIAAERMVHLSPNVGFQRLSGVMVWRRYHLVMANRTRSPSAGPRRRLNKNGTTRDWSEI